MSPLIVKLDGIRIWVYGRDHRPPHIHVEFGEDMAVIDIVQGKILAGAIPTEALKRTLKWLKNPKHRKLCLRKFHELNPHLKIESKKKRGSKQQSQSHTTGIKKQGHASHEKKRR